MSIQLKLLKDQKEDLSDKDLETWFIVTCTLLLKTFGRNSVELGSMVELRNNYLHYMAEANNGIDQQSVTDLYFRQAKHEIEGIILNLEKSLKEEKALMSPKVISIPNSNASFWNKLKAISSSVWFPLIGVAGSLITAAYFIGNEVGRIKYDEQKITLSNDNRALNEKVLKLEDMLASTKSSLQQSRDSLRQATDTAYKP